MRYWKFVCKNDTEAECFQRMLFGDGEKMRETVERVKKGDICFLYNLDTDVLFGPFKARSDGGMDIEREAWDGRFRAQVRVGCDSITIIVNASKDFSFLPRRRAVEELTEEEGRKILERVEAIKPPKVSLPPDLKEAIQRLDEEIHRIAHRIEEIGISTRMHPADREVELDRLKGEFYSKMKEFVWAVRRLDKQTGILELPSNK
jgi:hypothetical protein